MARRTLKPQLNQIRTWVRQGRTDAWIAHQLEATVQQIATFKQENELISDGEAAADGAPVADDVDLRAEDDAQIAVELEIPLGTVKSRLHAAVASFARKWQQLRKDSDPDSNSTT